MSNSTSTPTDLATPTPAPSPSSSPTPTSEPSPVPSPSSTPTDSTPTTAPSSSETSTPSLTPTPLTTSTIIETSTSSEISTTSSIESTTSSEESTITTPTPTPTPSVITSIITRTPTEAGQQTSTLLITSTVTPNPVPSDTATSTSSRTTGTAGLVGDGAKSSSSGGSGLHGGGLIAVAVVVPIVAVALLVLAGLFLWRKRKQRKDAEELRRKEVEEYGFNPNNDPTLPAVGGVGSAGNDGSYEMREDGSSGYRGWGTTAVASSGRKASTTMSGPSAGGIGMAYSDTTQTPGGAVSDTRSDNNLVDGRPLSTEAEALGAMGPAASQNRGGDINRGPSNASSSYSAANRSDGSGEIPGYGGVGMPTQYDTGNPYTETAYGSPPGRAEMAGQPIIRDVQARRNTRIENPSHFPQQSAGISQNF